MEDARLDPRFALNPMVTGPTNVRFYAGAPLIVKSGHALGTLCLIDQEPRTFDMAERAQLQNLAEMVMVQIDLMRSAGRVDAGTKLPNNWQFSEDLMDLCSIDPGGSRIVMLLELLPFFLLQHAADAVGVAPIAQFLADAAQHLREFVGAKGSVYYQGVGRFSIMLDMQPHEAETYTQTVQREMRKPLVGHGLPMELNLRAGLATINLEKKLAADALRKATVALNEATRCERPLDWFAADSDIRHQKAHKLLLEIPQAMAEGEFHLVYQPKLDVLTGRFDGVEALLRLTSRELDNVSPGEFIPLVERTVLIHMVTEWVLHTALAQLSEWRAMGLDLSVAVNVSSRNLEERGFMPMLQNACAVHNVEPRYLHIECTENNILTGTTTLATLREVQQAGIQVSLDDFGSGYCNLSCLNDMPVELLKIDQSLVKTIATEARALALLGSIVSLGHTMGYRLLGEGVETQEVFDALLDLKIDKIQGYFLSRPLLAQDVPAFLAKAPKAVMPQKAGGPSGSIGVRGRAPRALTSMLECAPFTAAVNDKA